MTQVSCGKLTSLPTAVMMPCATRIVPFSMRGPEIGTIVAPRMAKVCGSPPCAAARFGVAAKTTSAAAAAIANDKLRRMTRCIPGLPQLGCVEDADPDVGLVDG